MIRSDSPQCLKSFVARGGFTLLLSLFLSGPSIAAPDTQPPTVPVGLAARAVTATGFTLTWAAATDNVKVTGYEIFRDGEPAGTTSDLSRSIESLTPDTSYSLAVRARDARGNWSARSAPLVVRTGPDILAPTVPGGLKVTNVKYRSLTLAWEPAADNVKVTAYEVRLNGATLGCVAGRSKAITDLLPGAACALAVRARDAAGNWSEWSEPLATHTLADTTPPSPPCELRACAVGATRFLLRWTPAKDNLKVTAYEVWIDGVRVGTSAIPVKAITGLRPGTRFDVAVRAGDAAGNWSTLSHSLAVTTTADRTKPTAPSGLVAGAVDANGFTLSWTAAKDEVGVTGYEVLRNGISLGVVTGTTLRVTGLSPATTYTFKVRATDAAGNWSTASRALAVTTSPSVVSLPAAPAGLTAALVTSFGFRLTWQPVPGAVRYEVLKDGATLGVTDATALEVTGLEAGAIYRMTVRAGDAAGNWGDFSTVLEVRVATTEILIGFEPTEGYAPGTWSGHEEWGASGAAAIATEPVHGGTQALLLPPAQTATYLTHGYSRGDSPVTYLDLYALPVAAGTPETGVFFETDFGAIALTAEGGSGRIQVYDGDGQGGGIWRSLETGTTLDDSGRAAEWLHVTVRSDATAGRWDLYLDGELVAGDLGFLRPVTGATGVLVLGGSTIAATAFDEVLVSRENPLFTDADRDGIDDAWERANGLAPSINDRGADLDGDGLTNLTEYRLGTNPGRADTDGDGIPDGLEVNASTDPRSADSDGDGLPDAWEIAQGLDPRVASDGSIDSDGDGKANAQEYAAGTNPFDYFNGRALFVVGQHPASSEVSYTYDASGRLVRASYGGSRATTYARDPAGNLTSIAVEGSSGLVAWRAAHGLPVDGSGIGADDAVVAGDGLSNLAKYALGLDPHVAVTTDVPQVSVLRKDGYRYLALSYQRPQPERGEVKYTVEISTDGVTWRTGSGAVETVGTALDGNRATVTVRDALPLEGLILGRRIRLRIESPFTP